MFSRQEFRNNLLGCFEICLFMARGTQRFSGERQDALRSFAVPAFFVPIVLIVFALQSTGYPVALLLPIHALRIVATLGLFLGVVYVISRETKRTEHFFQFVTATNWLNIPVGLMILPVAGFLATGTYTMEQMESWAVFVEIAGAVLVAFAATHIFRIPWELGGFIGVLGLLIDDAGLKTASVLRDFLYSGAI